MKKLILLIVTLSAVEGALCHAQVIITPTPTAQDIITMLQGPNVTISNLEIHCHDSAYGLIDVNWHPLTSPVFYGQGFALTNGSVFNIPGPNNLDDAGTDLTMQGDVDLDEISFFGSFDASIIKFDCISSADTLYFHYVFGSEEYPEFDEGGTNDAFGVFISGPGISGTFTDSAENFAIIPGTNQPVCVNYLNDEENNQYYIENHYPDFHSRFQYNGFSTLLTGKVPVTPGETYRVKIAIADGSDGVWDSGVLFPAGAFRTTTLDFTGIEEAEQNIFTLYPNPATSTLTIESTVNSPQSTVAIHNAQGQLVTLSVVEGPQTTFDISSFSNGIYFLTLNNGEQTLSSKFVKQ